MVCGQLNPQAEFLLEQHNHSSKVNKDGQHRSMPHRRKVWFNITHKVLRSNNKCSRGGNNSSSSNPTIKSLTKTSQGFR
jgi:hypothetical protein